MHGAGDEHVTGVAEVRGRRAQVIWDGDGLHGDPELVARIERATMSPLRDTLTFLDALRAVAGEVVAVDVSTAPDDDSLPDPTTPGPEPIEPLPDIPDPTPGVPGTDEPPPVQPEPLAAA